MRKMLLQAALFSIMVHGGFLLLLLGFGVARTIRYEPEALKAYETAENLQHTTAFGFANNGPLELMLIFPLTFVGGMALFLLLKALFRLRAKP